MSVSNLSNVSVHFYYVHVKNIDDRNGKDVNTLRTRIPVFAILTLEATDEISRVLFVF